MSLWSELKRRNVYRVGAAYALVAWVVVQVASVFVPALNLPSAVVSFLAFVALLGLPVALVLAWLYELTPEGIKRTDDAPQDPALTETKTRRLDYVIIGAVAVTVVLIVVDRFALRGQTPPAAIETTIAAPSATPSAPPLREVLPNSVAVLPFENLSTGRGFRCSKTSTSVTTRRGSCGCTRGPATSSARSRSASVGRGSTPPRRSRT